MSIDIDPRTRAAQQRRVARAEAPDGPWERMLRRARAGRWPVTLVSAVAVALGSLCLAPVLDGQWWFPRVVAAVAVIAVIGGLSRSLRLPAAATPVLQFAALLMFLSWSFARDEARWGLLPGPAAIGRLQELVAQGQQFATDTKAPAGPDPGLLLLIVAGVALTALVVDTLAAGLDLPGLTLAPLAALFLVPWVVNRGEAPWWSFAFVALGWLAILSSLQRDRAAHWSPGARPGSPGSGLGIAAVATVLALFAGGLGTLRGPADPVGPGSGAGSGPVRIDALVSLRRALVSNDSRAVLTYSATTPRPGYLRLSILEDFDGEAWRPVESTDTAASPPPLGDGSRPSQQGPSAGAVAEYQLDVGPLTGTTLPSPSGTFESLNEWPVVWDQRTSLPIRADGQSIEGTSIGLVAAQQTLNSEGLRAASAVPPRPEQVYAENLADPQPLVGGELGRLAREVTAGALSPFDAATALQRWFTGDGDFTYSTQIDGGSDANALDVFLEERVGYCEQFAATMALMARSVGIPARVAVGFTQGRRDGTQWEVRGTDAHAWPELWMGTAGWVRFEPTPGAPTTATPLYTLGADPDQDSGQLPVEESEAPIDDQQDAGAEVDPGGLDAAGAEQDTAGQLPVRWILGLLVSGMLLLPGAVRLGRRRRRFARGDPDSLYREVVDQFVDLRLGRSAATPRATLAQMAIVARGASEMDDGQLQGPDDALERIRRGVEWQRYGRSAGATATLVDAAAVTPQDVQVVRRALARRAGWARRMRAALLPASVIGLGADRGPQREVADSG